MWFTLSQAGMAKITASREHFSCGTQCTCLPLPQQTKMAQIIHQHSLSLWKEGILYSPPPAPPPECALLASASYTILHPADPHSNVRMGLEHHRLSAGRSGQLEAGRVGIRPVTHPHAEIQDVTRLRMLRAKLTRLLGLRVVGGGRAPGGRKALCRGEL